MNFIFFLLLGAQLSPALWAYSNSAHYNECYLEYIHDSNGQDRDIYIEKCIAERETAEMTEMTFETSTVLPQGITEFWGSVYDYATTFFGEEKTEKNFPQNVTSYQGIIDQLQIDSGFDTTTQATLFSSVDDDIPVNDTNLDIELDTEISPYEPSMYDDSLLNITDLDYELSNEVLNTEQLIPNQFFNQTERDEFVVGMTDVGVVGERVTDSPNFPSDMPSVIVSSTPDIETNISLADDKMPELVSVSSAEEMVTDRPDIMDRKTNVTYEGETSSSDFEGIFSWDSVTGVLDSVVSNDSWIFPWIFSESDESSVSDSLDSLPGEDSSLWLESEEFWNSTEYQNSTESVPRNETSWMPSGPEDDVSLDRPNRTETTELPNLTDFSNNDPEPNPPHTTFTILLYAGLVWLIQNVGPVLGIVVILLIVAVCLLCHYAFASK